MEIFGWLGFKNYPSWEKAKPLGVFLGVLLTLVGGLTIPLFCIAFVGVFKATIGFVSGDQTGDYRYISMFLAFVIGAPFLVWRSHIAQEQTKASHKQNEIAINGQIVESISRAVENLGSVHTGVAEDSKQEVNLEVRVGALYALQRISDENENFHIQIMKIICAYIRSNAPRVYNNQGKGVPGARPREDVQIALDVIRDRSTDFVKSEIDKGYSLDLSQAELNFARLFGANLRQADLCWSNLSRAGLFRADLSEANLLGANLFRANLRGANLLGAKLFHADLSKADLRGADLHGAELFRAKLFRANLLGANLFMAKLKPDVLVGAKLGSEVISEERAKALHSEWGCIFPDDWDDYWDDYLDDDWDDDLE